MVSYKSDNTFGESMNKTKRIKQGSSPVIGCNIRRLREEKHMRNTDMAAKLQLKGIPISTSTLRKIEQGSCNPTTTQMIAVQKVLAVTSVTFFILPDIYFL